MRCALLDQAREQPGGEALLAAAYEGVHLVGGAVRDLLRVEHPHELDVLVEGEIEPLLARAGRRGSHARPLWDGQCSLEDARIDVARARRERYPHPGGLPVVEPASVAEDLLRRDFTVNAIAVRIDEGRAGEVHAAPGALEDLAAGRLRVLHDASFIDDPTRLLRLARYGARLRFVVEDHTAALAGEAIAARALDTVSGARIGAELRLGLAEDSALGALQRMDELGILLGLGLHTPLPEKLAADALALLPDDGRPGGLLMALLCEDPAILDTFEFPAGERDRIVSSARAAPQIGDVLASDAARLAPARGARRQDARGDRDRRRARPARRRRDGAAGSTRCATCASRSLVTTCWRRGVLWARARTPPGGDAARAARRRAGRGRRRSWRRRWRRERETRRGAARRRAGAVHRARGRQHVERFRAGARARRPAREAI